MPRKKNPVAVMVTADAAEYVGLASSTLEKMRVYPHLGGPPFISLNSRIVYRIVDLDAWMAARSFKSTRDRDRFNGKITKRKPRNSGKDIKDKGKKK